MPDEVTSLWSAVTVLVVTARFVSWNYSSK